MAAEPTWGTYDATVKQGAHFERTFVMPVTRATAAELMLRSNPESTTPVLTLSTSGSGLTVNGDGDEITITITSVQTAALNAQAYVWDLFLTTTGGEKKPLFEGQLVVDRAITRD